MKASFGLLIFLSLFAFGGLLSSEFISVSVPAYAQNFTNMIITGYVYNSSNASQGLSGYAVTLSLNGTHNVTTSGADGNFTIMIQTPNTRYEPNMTINSTNVEKTFPIHVSPIANSSMHLQGVANISAAATFTLNTSAMGGAAGGNASGIIPNVTIYDTEGNQVSGWNFTNVSVNNGGHTLFNITPSTIASGTYLIVSEDGAGVFPIYIRSGTTLTLLTQSSTNNTKNDFYPGDAAMVVAKFKDSSNNPITGLSPTASITLPNGTIISLSMNSTDTGTYKASFGSTGALGTYEYTVSASVSGSTAQMDSSFGVRYFDAVLSEDTDRFVSWSGTTAVLGGSQVAFLFPVLNLSSSGILSGSASGAAGSVDCRGIRLEEVTALKNSNSINASLSPSFNATATGAYLSTSVCKASFTAPAVSGTYVIKLSVNHTGQYLTVEKSFTVQNYMMKVSPVNSFGWSFKQSFSPNSNVSLKLSGYNASNNAELTGANITGISVTNLFDPMAGREIALPAYSAPANGLGLLNVTIPNQTGPMVLIIQATVAGDVVKSSAFFFSNYVTGSAFPTAGEGFGGGGMEGEQFSGIRCSGNASFMAMVKDASTGEAVQGATISAVRALRSEATGEDLTHCITNVTQGSTSSAGTGTMVVFFNSSCSLSGFHFMLINITYRGNQDALPSGFKCSNLNFKPNIYNDQGEFAWRISPRANFTINITNATILSNGSNVITGNMTVAQVFSFDPATGEKRYMPNTVNYANITGGTGSLTVLPSQFASPALSTWPSGFMQVEVQVCNKDGGTCGTSETGLQVTPFDVWVQNAFNGPPEQYVTGANISMTLMVRANVSRGRNITGLAGFQVLVGKPWEGEMTIATNYVNDTTSLLEDTWNSTNDWGFEKWNVTFALPTSISTGETIAMIKVTANNSGVTETAQTETFFTVQKFNVFVPTEEFVEFRDGWYNIQEIWGNWSLQNVGWNTTSIQQIIQNVTGDSVVSKSGQVCAKKNFNVTRYGNMGSQTLHVYNATGFVLVTDRVTSGVYDTVIFYNISGGNEYRVVNLTNANRTIMAVPNGAIYLWNIEGCWGVRIFNSNQSTAASGWIGTHQMATNVTIPYIVRKSATQPMAGTTVGIDNMIKQSLTGFGMEAVINTTDYGAVPALTDSRGVGFMTLNISQTGRMMVFWKANRSDETDRASFASGSSFESRAFQVDVTSGSVDQNSTVTLYKRQLWGWLNTTDTYEGNRSNFAYLPSFYMSVDFGTNLTRMDDDNNATGDMYGGQGAQNPATTVTFAGATSGSTGGAPGPMGDAYVLYWRNATAVGSPAIFKIGGLDQYNLSALVSDPIRVGTGLAGNAAQLVTIGANLTAGDYYNLSIERFDAPALADPTVGVSPYNSNVSIWYDQSTSSAAGTCNGSAGAASAKFVKIISNSSGALPFNASIINRTNITNSTFTNTLYYDLVLNRTYIAIMNGAPTGCFALVHNDTSNLSINSTIYYYLQQGSERFSATNPPLERISFHNYSNLNSHEARVSEYIGASTNYLTYLRVFLNATLNISALNYTNQTGYNLTFTAAGNMTARGSNLSYIALGDTSKVHLNMSRRILGKTLRFYSQTVREVLDVSGATATNEVQLLANEYTEAGYQEASCEGSLYQCYLNGSNTIQINNGGQGRQIKAISITRNSTEATVAFAEQNWGGMGMLTVNSSADNVTLMVCPKDFQKPSQRPVYDAVITNATTMTWQMMGPPTTTALRMYSPLNGSVVTSLPVGPSGCTVVKLAHPTGWSAQFGSSEIQLTLMRSSDGANETSWGGMVFFRQPGQQGGGGGQGG